MKSSNHKYKQTRDFLRKQIEKGVYPAATRLPTFTQLQKLLQISDNTLLRALSELESEGLLVRRRGSGTWVADKSSPPLIPGKKIKLGVLFRNELDTESLTKGFLADMLRGILKEWHLDKEDPRLNLNPDETDNLFFWEQKERGLRLDCLGSSSGSRNYYPNLNKVKEGKYDGLILLGIHEENWIKKLLKLNIPLILADYPGHTFLKDADQIFVNPFLGFQEAVDYYINQGLKRIHFLGSLIGPIAPDYDIPEEEWSKYVCDNLRVDPDSALRQSAWSQAMQLRGLTVENHQIHYETYNPIRIRAMLEKFINSNSCESPEAFICNSTGQAQVVKEFYHKYGIEVAVAGAGSSLCKENASTILVRGEELGGIAAERLVSRLTKKTNHYLSIGVNMNFHLIK